METKDNFVKVPKFSKKLIPVIAAIALLSVGLVAAYGGGFGFGGGMTDEERTVIQTAVENNDYNSWKTAMESQLTEEKFNQMQQRHAGMQEHRAAVEAALEAGDYTAWKTAVGSDGREAKMAEVVTEENFATFVKMHEAQKSGDSETAKVLAQELGLPEGGCGMKSGGFGRYKRF